MNLTTITTAIRSAVVSATGVRAEDVYWSGSKEAGGAHKFPRVELSCPVFKRIGLDERRAAFTDGGVDPDTRTIASVGNRRLTVTVKVEGDIQTAGLNAALYADRLTTRIDWTAPRALLKAAKCAVTDVSGAIQRDYTSGDRRHSVWIVELIVHAASIDLDTSDPDASWIETAHGTAPAEQDSDLAGLEFDAP